MLPQCDAAKRRLTFYLGALFGWWKIVDHWFWIYQLHHIYQKGWAQGRCQIQTEVTKSKETALILASLLIFGELSKGIGTYWNHQLCWSLSTLVLGCVPTMFITGTDFANMQCFFCSIPICWAVPADGAQENRMIERSLAPQCFDCSLANSFE